MAIVYLLLDSFQTTHPGPSQMCWLKESLLSRITPRYLSDLTSSRTMEFDESELSMFRLLYILLLRFVVGVRCLKVMCASRQTLCHSMSMQIATKITLQQTRPVKPNHVPPS